jgi:filamentous hemagglutinin
LPGLAFVVNGCQSGNSVNRVIGPPVKRTQAELTAAGNSGVARGGGAGIQFWTRAGQYLWQHPTSLLPGVRSVCFPNGACMLVLVADPTAAGALLQPAEQGIQALQCGDYGYGLTYLLFVYGPIALSFASGGEGDVLPPDAAPLGDVATAPGPASSAASLAGNASVFDTGPLAARIEQIRAQLPSDLRRSGNMAAADIHVDGVPSELAAHSSINDPSPALQAEGVVGRSSGIFDTFNVPNRQGDMIPRAQDSETKILDSVALRLGGHTSATGTINIFTELAACDSCEGVVRQFETRYPGIAVNILDNSGVRLIPPRRGQ